MNAYRIYLVQPDGRLQLGEAFHASNDTEAAKRADILAPAGQAAELWTGGRMVGRRARGGSFRGGS